MDCLLIKALKQALKGDFKILLGQMKTSDWLAPISFK